MGELGDMAQ